MSFIKNEDGQGMLEYVLVLFLLAGFAILALIAAHTVLQNKKVQISSQLVSADSVSVD